MERRRTLEMEEEEVMKEWKVLENLTFEEEQASFRKIYDNSYTEYICLLVFPRGTDVSATTSSYILGSYDLYYSNIKAVSYAYEAFTHMTKVNDSVYIVEYGKGQNTGLTYGHPQKVRIFNSKANHEIKLNFTVPAGTTLYVCAR